MSQPNITLADGFVGDTFVTLHMDVPLDAANPPPTSALTVWNGSSWLPASSVSVDSAAMTVTVGINYTFLGSEIVVVQYTDPTGGDDVNAVQGVDGADAANFSFVFIVMPRPGPAAPAAPTLDSGSDSGLPGDGITNDNTPTVSGTAAANATVKLYDTDGTTLLGTTTANGSGNWSITSSTLGNGSHTLTVTQTDSGNNTSPASTGLTVTIDTAAAAPTGLALTAGSDSGTVGDGITNAGLPTITGQAEPNAAVTLYDTDGTTVLGTTTANGSGNWSITSSALSEGTHNLTAKQTDQAGNVSAASTVAAVTVDTTGPTAMALSTTSAPTTAATNGATVATLSATDATAVHYGLAVGNGVNDADNSKFTISGNNLVAAQNLATGAYHLYLKATDAAGNDAFQIFTFNVVSVPSIASIVRAGASTVPASSTSVAYTVTFDQTVTGVDASDFALTATGTAAGTVASVTGSGATYTVTVNGIGGDGTLRLDLNSSGTGIQSLSGGTIAGGYTAGQTFSLDHTAPAAPAALAVNPGSDSGTQGDGISSTTTPVIGGTAEANATVILYDSDGTTVLGTTTADGSGNWSITSATLAEGTHTLTAKQVDAAGNVSAASSGLNYAVDQTPPCAPGLSRTSLPISEAGNGAAVASLTATDAHTVTYALVAGNGTVDADNARFTVSGNSLVASQNLAAGTYHVYVQATDAAGNATISALSFDVIGAPGVGSIVRTAAAPALTPAAATSVSYTVTFDQAVTGVDASDFALTATGTAAGTIAAVTGSGTTYTVTVNGIAGDGDLRLDLNPSGTGIQNAGGTAVAGGYTAGQTFSLDHTAPAAPVAFAMATADDSGASSSDAVTSVAAPHFSGTAVAGAAVTLYDTDGTTVLGTATADGSGNWTIASATLAVGAHTLTVRQADAAGNVSAASPGLAVKIDATAAAPSAPALAVASDTGVAGDDITANGTPTMTGTGEAFATVTLYDTDGTTVLGTATADADGRWSIASATLAEGAHAVTVKQTDAAGNVSAASAALNLTIDATAPAAPAAPQLAAASDTGTAGDGITSVFAPVVNGSAEAFARVVLYDTDGTTVLGNATADADGNWTISSTALALGSHAVTVKATDAAGNVSAASAPFNLTVIAAPTPTTTIDGVQVAQAPVQLPGGETGTQTVVPIVTAGRTESSGTAGVADIPLSTAAGTTVLLAQLGAGFGLTSTGGASRPAGSSAEQLIQAILASTPGHAAADQGHLTSNGQSFLNLLPSQVPLLVQTVKPVTDAATTGATLTLTGTSTDTQHTALVIDTGGVAAGNTLTLKNVDFAAVIGAGTVVGTTSGQVLTGDIDGQTFVVGAGQASSLLAGGGDDTLQLDASGSASASANGAVRADARAAAATLMHGGAGADTARFAGQKASYTIESRDGHVVVTDTGGTHDQAYVVNVETLQFADGSVNVENRAALSALAGLYADTLGRQADVTGFEFWGNAEQRGASLGQIAVDMIASSEGQTHQQAFNGDAAHDIGVLYQAVFHRTIDTGGAAFWLDAMQHGATLQQVADQLMHSTEIVGHALEASQWDFIV
jgi:hypothetical protein